MFSLRQRAAGFVRVAITGVTFTASSAHADATHDCVQAANAGQALRDDGKLISARDLFVKCSAEVCPTLVRDSCQRWSSEVEERLPSITLGAKSESGEDLAHVSVSIDGAVVARELDGHAIAVDPGPHQLMFEADGLVPLHQSLIVREGEKARPVVATLTARRRESVVAPKPASTSQRRIVPLVITGGVAVVGLAAFSVFGLWGKSERDHLESTCAPTETCAPGDVSAARTKLITADVSLAVSVVGAGLFTAFLVAPLFSGDSTSTSRAPRLGLTPTRSGVFGTLEWSY
jgi:hypothetical protein